MRKQSKRMQALVTHLSPLRSVPTDVAIRELKSVESKLPEKIRPCRFDQTVVAQARLGVDPRQADQIVRGSLVLPHGIGKTKRVLVFAQGELAIVAQGAGADYVGGKDLVEKIRGGWLDFDVAIASPDVMGLVGPLGKVLGPRGLMPSPKAGTVTQDIAAAVREYKAGKVEFRCDAGGNVNCIIGKLSFTETMLYENMETFLKYLRTLKPQTSKGQFIKSLGVSATMSPSISISA